MKKPSEAEINRMRILGYLGRKGVLGPESVQECERLFKKYPKEYGEQTKLGRLDADKETNPFR